MEKEIQEIKEGQKDIIEGIKALTNAVQGINNRLIKVEENQEDIKKVVNLLTDHAGEASKDRRSLLQGQKDLHKKFDRLKARQDINTATIKENILRIEDLEGSFEPEETK